MPRRGLRFYSPRAAFGDRLARVMAPWGGSSSFLGGKVSRVDWAIGWVRLLTVTIVADWGEKSNEISSGGTNSCTHCGTNGGAINCPTTTGATMGATRSGSTTGATSGFFGYNGFVINPQNYDRSPRRHDSQRYSQGQSQG